MSFRRLPLGLIATCALLTAALHLSGCASPKAVHEMTDQELTMAVIEKSGARDSLISLPRSLDEGLAKQKEKFANQPEIYDIMVKSFREAFDADKLMKSMEMEVSAKLTREEKLQILDWYNQPLGKKIYMMDSLMDTPEGQAAFNQYVDSFDNSDKKPDRDLLEFAAKLARATQALQIMVDTMSSISLGLITGFNGLLPDDKRMNIFEIDQRILTIRQHLAEQLAPSVVLVLAYTYKDLNDKERAELMSFYNSGVGRKYIHTITHGMSTNLERAAMRVGDGVSRGLASLPEPTTSGRKPASVDSPEPAPVKVKGKHHK